MCIYAQSESVHKREIGTGWVGKGRNQVHWRLALNCLRLHLYDCLIPPSEVSTYVSILYTTHTYKNAHTFIGVKNNQSKQTKRNETNRERARERTRETEKQSPESKRENKERLARNDKETHVSTDLGEQMQQA